MVYTAQSRSLAILEILVHLQKTGILASYSLLAARFDEELIVRLDPSRLSERWRFHPAPAAAQAIGDAWISAQTSAVLEVPSVIVPGESNYLINPDHPDFVSVTVGDPKPFDLDPRLLG